MNKMIVDLATGETTIAVLSDEEVAAVQADLATASARPYDLFKTTIISRMTDEEVDAFDAALTAATARQRRMWTDCTRVESDSPFFAVLHTQLAEAFGEERADVILGRPA